MKKQKIGKGIMNTIQTYYQARNTKTKSNKNFNMVASSS